jgi:hypothetical protein
MPVILVNRVVDKKRIIRKKWRAKEEERLMGSLTLVYNFGFVFPKRLNFA